MAENKKYWRGIAELENPDLTEELARNEFPESLPSDEFLGNKENLESSNTSRRDFLKYVGFSTAAATLAACESPVYESLPYVVAPEELIPGIANYYATSYYDGHDFASVLIKTREGRPIKVENNNLASINGSANTRVNASVLNLYDSTRLQNPKMEGKDVSWESLDRAVKDGLKKSNAQGKQVVLLTSTMFSPSAKKVVDNFASANGNFKHVSVDAFSYSNKLDAYAEATGKRAFPVYHFDKASVVVSFGADFISDWIGQSVAADFSKTRVPGKDMSRHIQFESNLSLTGANSDKRFKVSDAQMGVEMIALYNAIASAKGFDTIAGGKSIFPKAISSLAQELIKAGDKALVVSGGNNKNREHIIIAINHMLGNDGATIDYSKRGYFRKGDDKQFAQLMKDMNSGKVGAIIINNINPVYKAGNAFAEALKKVETSVYISQKLDETASACKITGAEHHNLEAWGDYLPTDGAYTLQQPTIRPLFDTRQLEDCLMSWSGMEGSYHQFIKDNWDADILGTKLWNEVLHDGVFTKSSTILSELSDEEASEEDQLFGMVNLNASAASINKEANKEGLELNFYQKSGMGVGTLSNNPWLQEFPDPISRVSWDNYLTISAVDALEMGIKNWNEMNGALNGNCVNIKANGATLENVPVFIQPGQTKGTFGLAVGYGRQNVGRVGDGVGVNAFALMNGNHSAIAEIELIEESEHGFACIQLGHTMMGREIVKETNLDTFLNEPAQKEDGTGWNQKTIFETNKGPLGSDETNLWSDFDHETGHMWNLSIDLNLCNGCGACVIACHAENNVPVVGKEEMRKHRDMHWLRIDRYYSSDMTKEVAKESDESAIDMYAEMEVPSENPEVFFQPVMCQHCNHAPCETVCPVIATSHSSDGLNHMTYNRCIGTRYCANNCPYKVRRFNWFQYHDGSKEQFDINYAMNDDLGKMVLNPDVTVRSRGVMEKCSMCIQSIQLGKLEAKKAGRKLRDGDINTACAAACDTGAMVFGDVNDKDSRVFKMKQDERMYHLLEEVGTQPSVFYQVKIKNNRA